MLMSLIIDLTQSQARGSAALC